MRKKTFLHISIACLLMTLASLLVVPITYAATTDMPPCGFQDLYNYQGHFRAYYGHDSQVVIELDPVQRGLSPTIRVLSSLPQTIAFYTGGSRGQLIETQLQVGISTCGYPIIQAVMGCKLPPGIQSRQVDQISGRVSILNFSTRNGIVTGSVEGTDFFRNTDSEPFGPLTPRLLQQVVSLDVGGTLILVSVGLCNGQPEVWDAQVVEVGK